MGPRPQAVRPVHSQAVAHRILVQDADQLAKRAFVAVVFVIRLDGVKCLAIVLLRLRIIDDVPLLDRAGT